MDFELDFFSSIMVVISVIWVRSRVRSSDSLQIIFIRAKLLKNIKYVDLKSLFELYLQLLGV